MTKALITGITGQDGSYLAEFLLEKGYEVYGLVRRKSKLDFGNACHLQGRVKFIFGDMTDLASLIRAIEISTPDEVYNLAAQSFVTASWETPLSTADINSIGVTNILEAIRLIRPKCRFYQASTSEMFGKVQAIPQNEDILHLPKKSYGVSKLWALVTRIMKVTECTLALESFLIMSQSVVVPNLSLEKSPSLSPKLNMDYKTF